MVAIKYAPTAAACLALCTAVGASVISERQIKVPAIAIPNAGDAQPGAFGGRAAAGNRPKAADDPPPANTFAVTGTVPGTLVVSNGSTTVTTLQVPGGNLAGLPSIDVSAIGTLSNALASFLAALTALANLGNVTGTVPVPLPISIPGLPGAPSTDPTALLAQLIQQIQALQGLLGGLGALPSGTPVPSNVTDAAAAIVNTILALPPSLTALLGGGVPSSPVNTVGNVVAFITALIPLLTSLAALLPVGGAL